MALLLLLKYAYTFCLFPTVALWLEVLLTFTGKETDLQADRDGRLWGMGGSDPAYLILNLMLFPALRPLNF